MNCSDVTECEGLYEVCDTICYIPAKTCKRDCSGNGDCFYKMSATGRLLTEDECLLGDVICQAYCSCDTGFLGEICDETTAAMEAKQRTRKNMVSALLTVYTEHCDLNSEDAITSLVSMLAQLGGNSYELTVDSCTSLLSLINTTLYRAAKIGLPFETTSSLLTAMDKCSIIVAAYVDGGDRRRLDSISSSSITDLVGSFTSLVGSDMILGHEDIQFIQELLRTKNLMTSATATGNISASVAQSAAEVLSGILPSSLTLSDLSDSAAIELGLSIMQTAVQLYDYDSDMVSNPMKVTVAQSDTTTAATVTFVLQSNDEQVFGDTLASNETVQTKCAKGPLYVEDSTCASGFVVSHTCNGTYAYTMVSMCPEISFQPVCGVIREGQLKSSTSDDQCIVLEYTNTSTTCQCTITVLSDSDRRRLGADVGDSGVLEVVAMTEYVAGDLVDTLATSGQIDLDSLQGSIIIISLFFVMWASGLLMVFYYSSAMYWFTGHKPYVEEKTPTRDKASTWSPEDKKEFVFNYINEAFNPVFLSSSWSWKGLISELKTHHMHYTLFTLKDNSERFVIVMYLLTIYSMQFFILAICWDLNVSLFYLSYLSCIYLPCIIFCMPMP
jgi:hypothetical protein